MGSQTLRLYDEFQSIARDVEFRHVPDAHVGIKYAGESLEQFHAVSVFNDEQVKDFRGRLNEVQDDLNWDRIPMASKKAHRLADDIGWIMLNKLIDCECKRG